MELTITWVRVLWVHMAQYKNWVEKEVNWLYKNHLTFLSLQWSIITWHLIKNFIQEIMVHPHHHYHLFWKRPFLPRYARFRRMPIRSPSTHPRILPIQDVNQALTCHYPHILSKSSFFSPYISPLVRRRILKYHWRGYQISVSLPYSELVGVEGHPATKNSLQYPWVDN